MKIKYFLSLTLIILLITLNPSFSYAKNTHLPINNKNIIIYSNEVQNAMNDLDFSPNQTSVEKIIKIYKIPLEKNMGYNFDKTFRYWLLYQNEITSNIQTSQFTNIMTPSLITIIDNLDESLKRNLISKRTYDFLSYTKKNASKIRITDVDKKFLDFILDCEKKNNSACSGKKLTEIVLNSNIFSMSEINKMKDGAKRTTDGEETIDEQTFSDSVESFMKYKFLGALSIFNLTSNKLIIKPNGDEINPYQLFNKDSEFIVDKNNFKLLIEGIKKANMIDKRINQEKKEFK
jgi:hypothetical protein